MHAPASQPMSGWVLFKLGLLCLSYILSGVSLSLLAPFYPGLAQQRGLSPLETGLVQGSSFLTTLLLSPLAASNTHRLGADTLLVVGLLITALGNITFGMVVWVQARLPFLCLSLLLQSLTAVGSSLACPAAYPLTVKLVPPRHQALAVGVLESSYGLGLMFGPPLGALTFTLGGFPAPFYLTGVLLLVTSVLVILLFPAPTPGPGEEEKVAAVSWPSLLSSHLILLSLACLSLTSATWYWYTATLQPFLSSTFSLTSAQTGLVFMGGAVSYTAFTPALGLAMDRGLGQETVILTGSLVLLASYLVLGPLPPLTSLLPPSYWWTVTSVVLQGLATAGCYLGSLSLMLREAPDNEQASAMVASLYIVGDCVGAWLGSALGGLAYQSYGFRASTYFPVAAILASILLFTSIIYCNKKRKKL